MQILDSFEQATTSAIRPRADTRLECLKRAATDPMRTFTKLQDPANTCHSPYWRDPKTCRLRTAVMLSKINLLAHFDLT